MNDEQNMYVNYPENMDNIILIEYSPSSVNIKYKDFNFIHEYRSMTIYDFIHIFNLQHKAIIEKYNMFLTEYVGDDDLRRLHWNGELFETTYAIDYEDSELKEILKNKYDVVMNRRYYSKNHIMNLGKLYSLMINENPTGLFMYDKHDKFDKLCVFIEFPNTYDIIKVPKLNKFQVWIKNKQYLKN